jgi:hypothetical protein
VKADHLSGLRRERRDRGLRAGEADPQARLDALIQERLGIANLARDDPQSGR